MNPRIAFLGDLTGDIYVREKTVKLGGAALNCAIWAKRLGVDVSILSAVGSDLIGERFVQKIQEEHIDGTFVERLVGDTSVIDILLMKGGERRYGEPRMGVLGQYHVEKEYAQALRVYNAICLTVYPLYFHVLNELRFTKVRPSMPRKPLIVVNFGNMKEFHEDLSYVERALSHADVLVFGLDKDKDELIINAIKELVPPGRLLLITLGRDGSLVRYRRNSFLCPAPNVKAKDTTGAGDAFFTAFLVAFLQRRDIPAALKAGTDLAAVAVQKVGAY